MWVDKKMVERGERVCVGGGRRSMNRRRIRPSVIWNGWKVNCDERLVSKVNVEVRDIKWKINEKRVNKAFFFLKWEAGRAYHIK